MTNTRRTRDNASRDGINPRRDLTRDNLTHYADHETDTDPISLISDLTPMLQPRFRNVSLVFLFSIYWHYYKVIRSCHSLYDYSLLVKYREWCFTVVVGSCGNEIVIVVCFERKRVWLFCWQKHKTPSWKISHSSPCLFSITDKWIKINEPWHQEIRQILGATELRTWESWD